MADTKGRISPSEQISLLAYWLIIKINGTNSVNFVGNSVNFVGNMLSNRNFSFSLPPPPTTILESFSGKFFWQRRHNPKKLGKFLSAPLFFSFPYAHVDHDCVTIVNYRLYMLHSYPILIFNDVIIWSVDWIKVTTFILICAKIKLYTWLLKKICFCLLFQIFSLGQLFAWLAPHLYMQAY
jgi:hypothetical protein